MLVGLRYILIIMGVPMEGCDSIKVDHMSVVKNMPRPESTLNKK